MSRLHPGPQGPDRWLDLKILLFGAGAVLAFFGMVSGRGWLVWVAFAPLAAAFLLRFLPGSPRAEERRARRERDEE